MKRLSGLKKALIITTSTLMMFPMFGGLVLADETTDETTCETSEVTCDETYYETNCETYQYVPEDTYVEEDDDLGDSSDSSDPSDPSDSSDSSYEIPVEGYVDVTDTSDITFTSDDIFASDDIVGYTTDANYAAAKRAMLTAIQNDSQDVKFSQFELTRPEAKAIYAEILRENPSLYYLSKQLMLSYYTSTDIVATISPKRDLTVAEVAEVEAVVREIFAHIDNSTTDLKRALIVHDWLVQNIQYTASTDPESIQAHRHDIYGALVQRNSVCAGYAKSYEMLLRRLGVPCEYIITVDGTHAWNIVTIAGKTYHVDCTWDDAVPDTQGNCSHVNFLRSDDGIRSTGHSEWNSTIVCSSTVYDNYWIVDVNSEIYIFNNKYYYLQSAGRDYQIVERSGSNIRVLADVPRVLIPATPTSNYVYRPKLNEVDGMLFCNDNAHIYMYDLDGNRTTVYTVPSGNYIEEFFVLDNGDARIRTSTMEKRTFYIVHVYDPGSYSYDPNSGAATFAERLYTCALNRASEASGKQYWTNQLASGRSTGAEAAYNFFFSSEVINSNISSREFVARLYRTFMGRDGATSEIDYWVNLISASGYSRETVFWTFVNTEEWANVCREAGINPGGTSNDPITNFAERLYTTCLGRAGESSGVNYWAAELRSGKISGSEVARLFFFGAEFTNAGHSNAEFVARLYRTFFNREADSSGLNFWLNNLAGGTSRAAAFNMFTGCAEWIDTCSEAGIQA